MSIFKGQGKHEATGEDGIHSPEAVQASVDQYAANEPDILRRGFYNSLLATFTEDEIGSQLARMNMTRLLIDIPDDRYWVVGGIIY